MSLGENKVVKIMNNLLKPLNFVAGLGTLAIGILYLVVYNNNAFKSILYVIFTTSLALLLLAGDFNLTAIKENCKFLITYLGRGFFNFFVGFWVFGAFETFKATRGFGLSDVGEITALIAYIALWVLGVFFILMHFLGGKAYITSD